MKRFTCALTALIMAVFAVTAHAEGAIPDHIGTSMDGIAIGTAPLGSAVERYAPLFKEAGDQYGVDPNLLAAICMQESSGRNLSYREDGSQYPAWGIMQIEYTLIDSFAAFGERTTGEKWSGDDRLDESKAVPFAAYLISRALVHYDCDYMKMIQSYNFGQTVLDRIIEEKGDDWLSERVNAVKYATGWTYDTYGDAEYIEHVLRYYHDDIEYSGAKVRIDGKLLSFDDQYPLLETIGSETYTLIPIRGVSEALDADVGWDQSTKTVTIKKNRHTIKLVIGSNAAQKDENEIQLEIGAMIKNGRTMVPLRFVMESLDVSVDWDGDTRTVNITT